MAVSRLFSVSLGPEIPAFLLMRKGNFASSIIASQLKLELSCQGAGRLQCWPKAGKGDGNAVRGVLEMSHKRPPSTYAISKRVYYLKVSPCRGSTSNTKAKVVNSDLQGKLAYSFIYNKGILKAVIVLSRIGLCKWSY